MIGFQIRASRVLLAAVVAIVAGGCAATIYKSTAGDYVDAAKQITVALQNAELSRSNAESQAKIDLIVEDRSCPIERPSGVYLRPSALGTTAIPSGYFEGLTKKTGLDSGANAVACRKLASCDARGGCGGKCFDADESACIDQIAHYYSNSASPADRKIGREVGANIAELSFPTRSADTYLATSALQVLAAYLDLLGKAADGKVKDFKSDATDLANNVSWVDNTYKSVIGKTLIPPSTSTTTIGSINALGAVIQDIATAVQGAKDNAAIRAAVNKSDQGIDAIMVDLGTFVAADIQLSGAEMANSNARFLTELQDKFKKSDSILERRVVMGQVQPLYADDVTAALQSAQAVFKKAREAHATLISLINNPTDDQLKQIRAQEFASFRTTATDLGSLIALFVK
jgi:hypothetical protein